MSCETKIRVRVQRVASQRELDWLTDNNKVGNRATIGHYLECRMCRTREWKVPSVPDFEYPRDGYGQYCPCLIGEAIRVQYDLCFALHMEAVLIEPVLRWQKPA